MNRSKAIIIIGVLVALLPILGFPRLWESYFQVLAGFSLVALSVWSNIDKKISHKAKAQKRQQERKIMETASTEKEEGVSDSESEVTYGRRITDFYPKTGQPGRRVSDIKWNTKDKPLS